MKTVVKIQERHCPKRFFLSALSRVPTSGQFQVGREFSGRDVRRGRKFFYRM